MTTMVTELYDALRDAGASEEKARRAAETMTIQDSRFGAIEGRLDRIEGRLDGIEGRLEGFEARFQAIDARFQGIDARFQGIDSRFAALESRLGTLFWVVGLNFAATLAILAKVALH